MHELKFRYYDYDEKRFHFWNLDNAHKLYNAQYMGGSEDGMYAKRWALESEQFIGLKDKNNKDIYVNDIMGGFGHLFLVKFGIARREFAATAPAIPYEVDIPSFYFERMGWAHPLYPIVKNVFGQHDLETLEVVGNVHETPEKIGSIYRDKNDRTLFNGDIVRLSDEWFEKPRGHCMSHFGHVWKAEDEWVLSYNHLHSECSDRLKDVPAEHMHYAGTAKENENLMR